MPEGALRHHAGLRTRTTLAFAALALVLSVSLALMTYGLSRRYLLSKREVLATQQAVAGAPIVARSLSDQTQDPTSLLVDLARTGDSNVVLRQGNRWFSSSREIGQSSIPANLQAIHGTQPARQQITIDGNQAVIVAVPIEPGGSVYYEIFALTELRSTLHTLATVLAIAALLTTLFGALIGRFASRRVLRPLNTMARTAASIAHGHRDHRLAATDPDLAPVVHAFNDMVDALQAHIDREARFASDVSHELRTPLTAIRAAIDVLDRRVDEQARPALEILRRQTRRFEHLVLDLLEISRLDSGSSALIVDIVDPADFLAEVTRRSGKDVPIDVDPSTPRVVQLDRRRIERVLTNLLDNADHYANGATKIRINGTPAVVRIAVDDAGPGIIESERDLIFERFHRGDTSRTSAAAGTGLGLPIAAEHCRLHGGGLTVEPSPDGGARFLIELPVIPS